MNRRTDLTQLAYKIQERLSADDDEYYVDEDARLELSVYELENSKFILYADYYNGMENVKDKYDVNNNIFDLYRTVQQAILNVDYDDEAYENYRLSRVDNMKYD